MRGGFIRGDNRFRPGLIGVADIRKAFCSEDGIVYSPGAWWLHEPQLISNQLEGLRFPHRAGRYRLGGIDPDYHRFRPRFEVVDVWKFL